MNTPKIQISNKTSYSIDSCLFTNILKQIEITEEILRGKEISICLVTDKEIRDLNKKFFGRDSVTDVLTFRSEFTHLPYLGEIVINIEGLMIRKDSYRDSLKMLFIHGVLHLIGYDHINTEEKRKMETKELRLCQDIKL